MCNLCHATQEYAQIVPWDTGIYATHVMGHRNICYSRHGTQEYMLIMPWKTEIITCKFCHGTQECVRLMPFISVSRDRKLLSLYSITDINTAFILSYAMARVQVGVSLWERINNVETLSLSLSLSLSLTHTHTHTHTHTYPQTRKAHTQCPISVLSHDRNRVWSLARRNTIISSDFRLSVQAAPAHLRQSNLGCLSLHSKPPRRKR